MRILLWPTYSYPGNVGADSLYLIGRNLIRATPVGEINWIMIVPNLKTVPVDDLDSRPDVQKVVVDFPSNYRMQEAAALPEIIWKYAGVDGPEPVDAVLSMSPARTVNLANAWAQKATRTSRQVIATWDLLVRDDGNGEFIATRPELAHQATGSLVSDVIYHESPVARKMTLDVARRFLSPSGVKHIMDVSIDIPQGIDVASVLKAGEGVQKRDKFTVYYGGRFSSSKRINEIAEIYDYFFKFGRDVSFVITTGSLDRTKKEQFEELMPHAELHVGLPQQEAWAIMQSCHASICLSNHELFGMAYWEQMAAGLGVIMQAQSWNKELLPPDYAHVASTPSEAAAMLRRMHDVYLKYPEDFEDTYGYSSVGATWVREHYDSNLTLQALVRDLHSRVMAIEEPAIKEFLDGKLKPLHEVLTEVLTDVDEITFEDLWKIVRKTAAVKHNFIGKRMRWGKSNAMLDGIRMARALGYKDCFIDGQAAIRKAGHGV
ncbi:glycosyltransferase [Arthrobacter phage Kitkat]|uniref:Glycosyltransferase n=1 Tax=Arthrobacter phage Kitkat TaxID=1796996 RepID=A0A140G6R9_9CAUD|nr:glycosyltransferase [Arthrobacter phage Kitkat]AMM44354.1 glycosyltransferase [Arthrobacter phage Kitkat]